MSAISSRNKGFTLLEILIAVLLFSLLTGALYGSYFAVQRSRDRASEGMEGRRELGNTLDLLRREIGSARFDRNDPLKRLRFVVEDRDDFGKPASNLEMTIMAPPPEERQQSGNINVPAEGRKQSGIYNVQYRMVEKDKRLYLTRKEQDVLREATVVPAYPQMETISAFLVECYDGSKWVKSWDTSLNNKLPQQVRITIQVEEEGNPVEFSVVAMPRVSDL